VFKKLLAALGIGLAVASTPAVAGPTYQPYPADSAAQALYNLLFCDDPAAFAPNPKQSPVDWEALLYGPSPDPAAVAKLANDPDVESRVRALAFNWLHAHGQDVPKGIVLGVVIEVPLEGGLDVLAAYPDGSVRYLNQAGKVAVVEPDGLPDANQMAKDLIDLSQPIVARIGPWDKPRLPPPSAPDVRITFLVSDGLYFGQGPLEALSKDPLAGALLSKGAALLSKLTAETVEKQR
jgi:hypothetical protein